MTQLLAGALDRRITLQERTDTRDAAGEPIPAWTTLDTVWAALIPLTGREQFEAQQVNAQRPAKFQIRYRDDVTETMRISWDGEVWDINGISQIGRREGLELTCTAAVP